jgi:hypothetical protein
MALAPHHLSSHKLLFSQEFSGTLIFGFVMMRNRNAAGTVRVWRAKRPTGGEWRPSSTDSPVPEPAPARRKAGRLRRCARGFSSSKPSMQRQEHSSTLGRATVSDYSGDDVAGGYVVTTRRLAWAAGSTLAPAYTLRIGMMAGMRQLSEERTADS